MTDTPDLLDRLKDWIVAYDPERRMHFNRDLTNDHPELMERVAQRTLTDAEIQSYQVIMSLADARGLFDKRKRR